MRDLCRERRRNGVNIQLAAAIMDGHVPTFAMIEPVGEQLVHESRERETALLEDAGFAVLGEDDVGGVECRAGSDGYAFFAGGDLGRQLDGWLLGCVGGWRRTM